MKDAPLPPLFHQFRVFYVKESRIFSLVGLFIVSRKPFSCDAQTASMNLQHLDKVSARYAEFTFQELIVTKGNLLSFLWNFPT